MEESKKTLFKRYKSELKARRPNLPIVLILLYSIPISMTVTICQTVIFNLFRFKPFQSSDCFNPVPEVELKYIYIARLVENLFLFLAYPISGWLADIKLGRGTAITVSLWLSWSGMLTLTCSYAVQYSKCGLFYSIASFLLDIIGLLLIMFGLADFHTNALAYIIDQMPEASTSQIKSYIQWFTWTMLLGFGCDYIEVLTPSLINESVILYTLCFVVLMLSLALCIHQLCKHKFISYKPSKKNSYLIVYQVLKFSLKNKSAINRSSLTFWEDRMPNRIDLGKQRYGGPFLEEEVENVKLLGKLFLLFLLLGGIFLPYFNLANQGTVHGSEYKGSDSLDNYSSYLLWQGFVMIGVALIPILELVVNPCFPKLEFLSSPMKGLIVAHVCAIIPLLMLLGIQLYAALSIKDNMGINECYLLSSTLQSTVTIKVNYLWLMIPCVFIGVYVYLTFSQAFQVVCSQAPYGMSGLLMGTFWLTRAVFIGAGVLLSFLTPLLISDKLHEGLPFCTFWSLLVLLFFSIFGLLIFSVFVYFHSKKKITVFQTHQVIEDHYLKYLSSDVSNEHAGLINDEIVRLPGWSDNFVPHD